METLINHHVKPIESHLRPIETPLLMVKTTILWFSYGCPMEIPMSFRAITALKRCRFAALEMAMLSMISSSAKSPAEPTSILARPWADEGMTGGDVRSG